MINSNIIISVYVIIPCYTDNIIIVAGAEMTLKNNYSQ